MNNRASFIRENIGRLTEYVSHLAENDPEVSIFDIPAITPLLADAIAGSLESADQGAVVRFAEERASHCRRLELPFPPFLKLLKFYRRGIREIGSSHLADPPIRFYDAEEAASLFDILEVAACEAWEAAKRPELHSDPHLFRNLINKSNDAIFIVDPDLCRPIYVNDKACENLMYARYELLEMHVYDYASNVPDLAAWEALVSRLRRYGSAVFETWQRRRDGTMLPVELNVRFVTHEDRQYIVSFARDITERKKAQEALLEQKNKLEAVIAAIGDGITLQDLDYRILYQNDVHKNKQGDHVGEICYSAYQKRDVICEGCLLEQVFQDGQVRRRETTAATPEGTIHMEVSAGPVKDAHGKIIAGIEVVRDITSRKKMEEELIKAQKLESLGVMAGGIAHDFNNLLTSILGSITILLKEAKPGDHIFELLSETELACLRARGVARQLLTFSRGGQPIRKVSSARRLIEETVGLPLRGTRVVCEYRLSPDLWSTFMDEGQISQVLNNLVINAVQAMPEGGTITVTADNVTITGRESLTIPPGNYIRVTFKDQGTGIVKDHLPRIFDPYFTTKSSGTGLGLAACYSIIKQHQGCITVDSKPGHGSVFTIYLPAAPEDIERESQDAVRAFVGKGNIMVMDDDEGVRLIAERMLKRMGFQVTHARNGAEALALYEDAMKEGEPFAAVIVDLTIHGGMGGKETAKRLLQLDPKAKTFVTSGYSEDSVMANYGEFGFVGAVPKPFRYEEMARELKKIGEK